MCYSQFAPIHIPKISPAGTKRISCIVLLVASCSSGVIPAPNEMPIRAPNSAPKIPPRSAFPTFAELFVLFIGSRAGGLKTESANQNITVRWDFSEVEICVEVPVRTAPNA